jgi:hypothetical protein
MSAKDWLEGMLPGVIIILVVGILGYTYINRIDSKLQTIELQLRK